MLPCKKYKTKYICRDILSLMVDTFWRERLVLAVERSGMSLRATSLKAGLGSSYLHGLITKKKEPSITSLGKLADALGVSATWLAYGVEIDASTERLLATFSSLSAEERKNIMFLAQSMAKSRQLESSSSKDRKNVMLLPQSMAEAQQPESSGEDE